MIRILSLFFWSVAILGCRVEYPKDATFACNITTDCGGDGFVCFTEGRRRGICCQVETEVCDGKDNDCNGQVDELLEQPCYTGIALTAGVGVCRTGSQTCVEGVWSACLNEVKPLDEVCNGLDDDCDGQIDEAFDFNTDASHCGGCGKACSPLEKCENALCVTTVELECADRRDDDEDGLVDCADVDCEGKTCGTGCVCRGLQEGEGLCGDLLDNENDGFIDCSDVDCEGQSCGNGCVCLGGVKNESDCSDGVDNEGDGVIDCLEPECNLKSCGSGCECRDNEKKEIDCRDALDNDGDGFFDCIDSECLSQLCKPAPNTFVCNVMGQCVCNGLASLPQESGLECTDMQDNDCNGKVDCEEVSCNNQSCGDGCLCKLGVRAETKCDDFFDNDGDGATDCADDIHCPVNTPCKYVLGQTEMPGTCRSDKTCQ